MAKRKARKTKKTFKQPKRVRKTEADQIRVLLKYTERSITEQGTGIDDFFKEQAARLRQKLEELTCTTQAAT